MFNTDEQVRHQDGRVGVVKKVFTAVHHNECVLVQWPDGLEIVRESSIRHAPTVTLEDVLRRHPPNREAVEAHKTRMLQEIADWINEGGYDAEVC